MLHVITLYSVPTGTADAFVRSVRGQWHTLARSLAPALVATELLQHELSPAPPFFSNSSALFACLDFWTSPDAYRRACLNPPCRALFLARRQMASSAFELGAFAFPGTVDSESLASAAV